MSIRLILPVAALAFAANLSAQLPPVPTPAGNPTTPDKVNLGKALFWDEQMSSTRTVACGTCHTPNGGGGDPRAGFSTNPGPDGQVGTADDIHGSPGVPRNLANGTYAPHAVFGFDIQVTGRMAPSAFNAAYNPEQFWDGRSDGVFKDPLSGVTVLPKGGSLENQASKPPIGDAEMAHEGRGWQDVANRVAASQPLALATSVPPTLDMWIGDRSYPQLFRLVFGDPAVTPARIVMAIAAYERVLISDHTPFDLGTMTARQAQGFQIFGAKARCQLCHEGVLFRDDTYHNTGVRPSAEDSGRFGVTANPVEMGAFKTPGLRNVALRTAFMHNGGFRSLAEVIEFYDRGGDFFDNLDPGMQPLGLTVTEKLALLDFLQNGLLDPRVVTRSAPFNPPALYTESIREPQNYGQGGIGSGGVVPSLVAYEPAMLGNPNFTLSLADGLGGAAAVLAFDGVQGFGFPIGGVPMLVGMSSAMVLVPLGTLQGSGAGNGYWSGALAIPNNASMSGAKLYLQGFLVDAGVAAGVSATDGLTFELFDPR